MKKTFVFLCSFLLINATALAQQAILVQPGQTLAYKAEEVTNSDDGVVTFEFTIEQNIRGAKAPLVEVTEEHDGFRCEVLELRKISSFTFMGKVRETFQARTAWYPGVEWSSCAFEISHPEFNTAKVVLYIEGSYATPISNDFDW